MIHIQSALEFYIGGALFFFRQPYMVVIAADQHQLIFLVIECNHNL